MVKKYTTPLNIIFFLWGVILLAVSWFYPDYTRYYLYLSILIIIPVATAHLMKERRMDKINNTTDFKSSIFRMLILALVLVVIFFITKQNHL